MNRPNHVRTHHHALHCVQCAHRKVGVTLLTSDRWLPGRTRSQGGRYALIAIMVRAVHPVSTLYRGSYLVAQPDAIAARAAWQNATALESLPNRWLKAQTQRASGGAACTCS